MACPRLPGQRVAALVAAERYRAAAPSLLVASRAAGAASRAAASPAAPVSAPHSLRAHSPAPCPALIDPAWHFDSAPVGSASPHSPRLPIKGRSAMRNAGGCHKPCGVLSVKSLQFHPWLATIPPRGCEK